MALVPRFEQKINDINTKYQLSLKPKDFTVENADELIGMLNDFKALKKAGR